ncbi:MAG: hypothetical protein JW866_08990 [Ignavibacteriales bacterium]|nr:hypothetical protein [Ignavibacteriales bacterium]
MKTDNNIKVIINEVFSLITLLIFAVFLPLNVFTQVLFGNCEYSHSSLFNSYNHFENGIYASTIASKGELVKLNNDLSYIYLDGEKYSLYNPEYFPMPDMPTTEQILFDSKNAVVVGITLNGDWVTVTVLTEISNGKLRQTSFTLANKRNSFSNIKKSIDNGEEIKTYINTAYHFTFNYPTGLSKLPVSKINEINNLEHNKKTGLKFESGFENNNNENPPLILVYILKSQQPYEFNKAVEKYIYYDIDVSNTVNTFNSIQPLINSASFEKPLVDLENKIIIFTGEMDLKIWPYSSKGKGMFVQFYGRDKIVQINFATTTEDFEKDFEKYFAPIISSFSFSSGYGFAEATKKSILDSKTLLSNPVFEFINGNTSKFVCDGLDKGKGLKFSIKYPQSWKSEEGNRPHIVRKFSDIDLNTSIMLILNKFDAQPSKEDIQTFLGPEFAREMIPSGGSYIKSEQTVIEGEPAMVLDYHMRREKLGVTYKVRMKTYSIIYKSYLLQVQFAVSQNPLESPEDLNSKFDLYEPLFNSIINSLILISKWEN